MSTLVNEGSLILLYLDRRRQWLLNVEKKKEFHTHKGIVKLEDLIGKPFGTKMKTSLGSSMWILRPTTYDLIMHTTRQTQIMYPKDIGFIILKLSLSAGSRVLEIGTGSGAMTLAAAMAIRPTGHVYSYDVRKEFASIALRNLKRAHLEEYVTIHIEDASKSIQERDLDAAIIDIAEPWSVVAQVRKILLDGAPLVSFCPTYNQAEKAANVLGMNGFENIQTFECLMREIRAETGKTRPVTSMIAHTGFMTFAHKLSDINSQTVGNATGYN